MNKTSMLRLSIVEIRILVFTLIETDANLYINLHSDYLSVCNSCSPLPAYQPWQMRYQKKAHKPEKVKIIFLKLYNQYLLP